MLKILVAGDSDVRDEAKALLVVAGKPLRFAEAQSVSDALSRCFATPPDFALVDASAESDESWVERILDRSSSVRIIILARPDETSLVWHALHAGAVGALTKGNTSRCLAEAIAAVGHGRRYLEPALANRLALARFAAQRSPMELLSERELDILVRFASGATVKQMASDLRSSAAAIGVRLRKVTQKLGAVQRYDLALIAQRHGLLDVVRQGT